MKVAVVPVRNGVLPNGALETITEAEGTVLLAGTNLAEATDAVAPVANKVIWADLESFAPAAWARTIAPHLQAIDQVLIPASPDGRDLAPRFAIELGRPLISGVVELKADTAVVVRHGGLVLETLEIEGPFVATVAPGVIEPVKVDGDVDTVGLQLDVDALHALPHLDTESLAVTEPDASSLDLSEAKRIIAGGAGLGSQHAFDELAIAAELIEASLGGTRVVMDKGWIDFDRQIGTTGVMVNPELYIALGISGAVQHTAGLGEPSHIISVNDDPHCPMMAMADLALVTDAPSFLAELTRRL